MYFKKIDMHGFKSFADPVSVEFHKGITCVVGPNGSGKSNISDALRWVLGEQSPKTLRGGKMEEVIFAGTAARKSKGMAEVTLVIDNTDRSLDIDYAEVAITRKMYRSGESEYFINNNQCRLKDIRELIMDTGIAVDGYSIIGQGKISDIVSNKAESRREIFEEAAGIVKYRSKKTESERKLESARHNLERVNDIIGEIEGRIDTLKEDSLKAKEYIQLRERQKSIEINIALKNIEIIELKNEHLKDDMQEISGGIESYQEQRQSIETDIVENRERNAELDILEREAGEQLLARSNELSLIKNAGDVSGEKIAGVEKDCARVESEMEAIEAKLTEELSVLAHQTSGKNAIQDKIEETRTRLNRQSEEATVLFDKMNEAAGIAENRRNKIYELYNTISTKKAELQSYENIVGTLARRKNQILAEQKESGDVNSGKRTAYEELLQKTQAAEESVKNLKDDITARTQTYATCIQKEKDGTRHLQSVRIEKGEVSARKRAIEEMEASYEGYNHAVRFIMKNAGVIGGIYGVVADLIKVPHGYEIAIETALGQALQNIICEHDTHAQKAVRLLKEHRAGRLTFLPVSSIRPNPFRDVDHALGRGAAGSNRGGNFAGVKGLASQCIQYDAKYTGIMEYLLGRVVLVDNLENAVKLSKQSNTGARFVTLEGDVINPGGAITGGASRQGTGGNLLERKAEAERLEDRLITLAETELSLSSEIGELRQQISRQETELESLRQTHRNEEITLTNLTNRRDQMKTELSGFLESEAKWKRELDDIQREEQITFETTERLKSEIQDASDSVVQIEAKTDTDQKEYEEIKAKAEAHSEAITETKLQLAALESEKNNHDVLLERINTYINELNSQKAEREELLISLRHQKEVLLAAISVNQEEIERRQEEIAGLEEQHKDYQEEKTLTVRYLKEVEEKRAGLDKIILDFQSQKHELELKLTKNESQVDSYKNRLWEEFEVSYIHAIEFKRKEFVMSTALKEAKEIRDRIKELGEVNIGAISDYETTSERYQFLQTQKDDMLTAIKSLVAIIEDMDKIIRQKFKESFEQIAEQFTEVFKSLFGGGTAELKLENADNLAEAAVEIAAQPPGKRLQNINLMSGGEKTLTAIALMAAVLRVKPAPFVILDEVEAALDEANIVRFAKYLKEFRGIQFVLVTHQKATMEFADVLYGVTMPEQGISRVISLKLGDSIIEEL